MENPNLKTAIAYWRQIQGYGNKYAVNSDGAIRNTLTGTILKPTVSKPTGYAIVTLKWLENGEKKQRTQYVHRLVADAFLPNPASKRCIDHINAIKTDNRVCNLRWVTYSENMRNPETYPKMVANRREEAARPGWKEKQEVTHRCQAKAVICIETGLCYPSAGIANRILKLPKHYVHKACHSAQIGRSMLNERRGKTVWHFRYV